jgi:pimeloyl-ACP methyl ester carboxylesterase
MALAASLKPNLFSKLVLIDPVIMQSDYYGFVFPEEHYAARRRNQWESPDEMFNRFKDRPPFSLWDQRVLRDYCDYGLLPNPDGDGFVLACPPAIEATVYQQSTMGNIYPDLPRVTIPVLIVRLGDRGAFSPTDMLASPTNPELANLFPNGEDLHLKEYTHFAPMQAPDRIADIVRDFARG